MTRTSDLDLFLEEEMADPEFRAAYDEIAPLVDFGCALAIAREQRRMSQTILAERAGVPRAEIGRIEKGDMAPSLAAQVRLAHALNARLEVSANGRIDFVLFPQPVTPRAPKHLRPSATPRAAKSA